MERTLAVALAAVTVLAVVLQGPAAVASRPAPVSDEAAAVGDEATAVGDEAAPTGPYPGDDQPENRQPVKMPNTTAKLLLPGGGEPGAAVTGLDLGAAIAVDRRTTVTRLGVADVERRFEAASTDEERRAVVERGLDRIGNRTRELRAAEARAYRQYADGNRSLRSLVLTLAQIDAQARGYRAQMRRLAVLASDVPEVSLRTQRRDRFIGRAGGIYTKLETLTGPVRRHVARSVRGSVDGGLVYVAAADQGVVLAAVVDGTYARETLRADRIEPGPGHPIEIRELAEEAYPWAWNHQVVNRLSIYIPPIGVWKLDVGHSQGQLLVYVDRGTESIFREVQRLQPERLPNRSTTADNDGLTVTVNRTFPGGPLEVTVVDNVTGRPVGSVVTLGPHHLGRTGPDGELWTVAPRGEFTVTVRQGPNTVNVSVPAMEFPTADE